MTGRSYYDVLRESLLDPLDLSGTVPSDQPDIPGLAVLFAHRLREMGFQIIAPSRFGYLRSAFPDDASPAHQADILVELLDHLGIDRVPVIGGSARALTTYAGGPSQEPRIKGVGCISQSASRSHASVRPSARR